MMTRLLSKLATTLGVRDQLLKIMDDPKRYVSNDMVSGQLQLELLKRQGCQPTSKVLELGCGCLHLGIPLLRFLNESNYVGVPAQYRQSVGARWTNS